MLSTALSPELIEMNPVGSADDFPATLWWRSRRCRSEQSLSMAEALFCPSPIRLAASAGPPPVREWKPLARVIFGKCRVYRKRASVGVQCQRRRPIGRRAETEPLCCGQIDESVKSSREGNTLLPSFLFISFTFSKRMRIFILHRNDPKSVIAPVVFLFFLEFPCPLVKRASST